MSDATSSSEEHGINEIGDVRAWLTGFLARPHQDLGREGNVCPFVVPALRAKTLHVESVGYDSAAGWAGIADQMRCQIESYDGRVWPEGKESIASLVTVLRDMPDHHWPLLDEAQRHVKGEAVRRGLMIGQFHPDCPEPSV